MPEIEAGVVGKVVAGVDGGGSAYVGGGEVGPAARGGIGVVGELRESEVEVEERGNGELKLAGVRAGGGGVLEVRGGELVRE